MTTTNLDTFKVIISLKKWKTSSNSSTTFLNHNVSVKSALKWHLFFKTLRFDLHTWKPMAIYRVSEKNMCKDTVLSFNGNRK